MGGEKNLLPLDVIPRGLGLAAYEIPPRPPRLNPSIVNI